MLCALALAATIASQHYPDRGFNQQNPGIGLECDATDWAVAIGEYRNSYRRTTSYAVAAWLPLHARGWSLGPVLGPATGYDVPWMGGLLARWRGDGSLGINLILAPPAQKQGSVMLGLQVTWRLP